MAENIRGRGPATRPLGYDPFDGKPMVLKQAKGQSCFVFSNKRWLFGPFRTRGELFVAFSTRDGISPDFPAKQAEKMALATVPPPTPNRGPVTVPLSACPFSGKKVAIVLSDASKPEGSWTIKGEHYFIGGFPTERHAQFFFSTREGRTPQFRTLMTEVVNREKPESADEAFEGTGVEKAREASELLTDTGFGPKE